VVAGLRQVKEVIDVPGAADRAAREVLALAARGREPAAREEFVTRVFQDLAGPLLRRFRERPPDGGESGRG
jgi:hypothetical protein